MKSRRFFALGALTLATACMLAVQLSPAVGIPARALDFSAESASSEEIVGDYAVENQHFKLSFNSTNGVITLTDKANGKEWLSNPRYEDSIGSATPVDAQFTLTYYDENNQPATMDSYADSVANGTFTAYPVENGLKVVYTVGDDGGGVGRIPQVLSDARFKELFLLNDAVDEDNKDFVQQRYRYEEESNTWTWKTTTANLYIEQMLEILTSIGYDTEDLEADNAENGVEDDGAFSVFEIAIEYTLTETGLTVRVPLSEIKEPSKFRLQSMELMPFFGAAKTGETGYILIPDGCGSLIRFSDDKPVSDLYSARVYGTDYAKTTDFQLGVQQTVRMPVFGLKAGDNSFLAIIEEGDALASIQAYRAGRINMFNAVYSSYTLREMDTAQISTADSGSAIPVFQRDLPAGDIVLRYVFQSGAQADYSGMATAYRNYLLENGYERLSPDDNLPFTVETVGAINAYQKWWWFQTVGMEPVTSFAQDQEILQALLDNGVENIHLKLSAWLSGGFQQKIASKPKVEKVLGGEKALRSLASFAAQQAIKLYPEVSFMTAASGGGFSKYRQGARTLNQSFALKKSFDIVTGEPLTGDNRIEDPTRYVLSPSILPDTIADFLERYTDWDLSGLSVADLGDSVYSDYKMGEAVDRQMALGIQEEQLQALSAAGLDVAVEGGNIYALKNASLV